MSSTWKTIDGPPRSARHQRHDRRQISARRCSAHRDPARVDAERGRVLGRPDQRGVAVLGGRGERVLGRQPVVRRHDHTPGAGADLLARFVVLVEAPQPEPTPVEVDVGRVRPWSRRRVHPHRDLAPVDVDDVIVDESRVGAGFLQRTKDRSRERLGEFATVRDRHGQLHRTGVVDGVEDLLDLRVDRHSASLPFRRRHIFPRMSVDVRTRVDGATGAVDPASFFDTTLPAAFAGAADLLAPAVAHLAPPPLTVAIDGDRWTMRADAGGVVVDKGDFDGAQVLTLDGVQLADVVHDQVTPMGWFTGGQLNLKGRLERSPRLVAVAPRRARHPGASRPGRHALPRDRRRSPRPRPDVRLDDPPTSSQHFLEQAGFLHIRGVFTEDEMAAVLRDMDAAAPTSPRATAARGGRGPMRRRRPARPHAGLRPDQRPSIAALDGGRAPAAASGASPATATSGERGRRQPHRGAVQAHRRRRRHLRRPVAQGLLARPPQLRVLLASPSASRSPAPDATSGQLRVVAGSHRALVWPALRSAASSTCPIVDLPTRDRRRHRPSELHAAHGPAAGRTRAAGALHRLPPSRHRRRGSVGRASPPARGARSSTGHRLPAAGTPHELKGRAHVRQTPPELHRGTFIPDLLIAALDRNPDKPAVYLGDDVLTGRPGARRDQPLRPGLRRAGHRAGKPGGDALDQPARGALHHGRQHGHRRAGRRRCTRWARSTTTPTSSRTPASRRWCSTRRRSASGPASCTTGSRASSACWRSGRPTWARDLLELAAGVRAWSARGTRGRRRRRRRLWPTPAAPPASPRASWGPTAAGATMTQIQMAEWEWPEEVRFLISTPL